MGAFGEVVADGPFWSAPMESLTEYHVPNRAYSIGSSVTVEPGAGVEGTNAFRFDGSISGNAVYLYGYWPKSSDFTGELWVKGGTVKASTLMFHSYTNSYLRVYLGTTAQGVPEGYVGQIDSPMITATTNVIDGEWHHVAITHTGGTVRLYVDGVEEAMTTESILVPPTTSTAYVSVASTVNRSRTIFDQPQYRFDGLVDNPAVFATALSPERITAHYGNPDAPRPLEVASGAQGSLSFGEFNGPTVALKGAAAPKIVRSGAIGRAALLDFIGASVEFRAVPMPPIDLYSGLQGVTTLEGVMGSTVELKTPVPPPVVPPRFHEEVLADNPRYYHRFNASPISEGSSNVLPTVNDISYVEGRIDGAIKANSSTGSIEYPLSEDIYTGQWTIEAWFKIETTKDYNNILRISHVDGSKHLGLRVRGSEHAPEHRPNTIELFTYDDWQKWGDVTTPPNVNVNDGEWHYVVVQAKGSGLQKALRMCVDGVWYTTGSANPFSYPIGGLAGQTQRIAAGIEDGGIEAWIDGAIDEVAVYNYGLSEPRIDAHFVAANVERVLSIEAGQAGGMTFGEFTGPTLEITNPPMALMSGPSMSLSLGMFEGPSVAITEPNGTLMELESGLAGQLVLAGREATLSMLYPAVEAGSWFIDVEMPNKGIHVENRSASLQVRNSRKRERVQVPLHVRSS